MCCDLSVAETQALLAGGVYRLTGQFRGSIGAAIKQGRVHTDSRRVCHVDCRQSGLWYTRLCNEAYIQLRPAEERCEVQLS